MQTIDETGITENITSCTYEVNKDLTIKIPETSLLSSHVISKAPVSFPESFTQNKPENTSTARYGIATDLGTTTIAIYLCEIAPAPSCHRSL